MARQDQLLAGFEADTKSTREDLGAIQTAFVYVLRAIFESLELAPGRDTNNATDRVIHAARFKVSRRR